jgi:hypothetical protein
MPFVGNATVARQAWHKSQARMRAIKSKIRTVITSARHRCPKGLARLVQRSWAVALGQPPGATKRRPATPQRRVDGPAKGPGRAHPRGRPWRGGYPPEPQCPTCGPQPLTRSRSLGSPQRRLTCLTKLGQSLTGWCGRALARRSFKRSST